MNIRWFSSEELYAEASKRIIPSRVVLDVGAGIHPQQFFTPALHIIVEPYMAYIKKLMENETSINHQIYLNSVWTDAMKLLPDKSIDTIMAIDLIEHFNKEDGILFLAEAERVARCQIVIFTPLGMFPQTYQDNDTDRWGMQGGKWQNHKSGWMPEDFFGDKWEFLICKDFIRVDQHEEMMPEPLGAFWAIKTFLRNTTLPEERLYIPELPTILLGRSFLKRIMTKVHKSLPKWLSVNP
jgi:hypothetical protein